jgi:phosphatidylinositol-3,4,5-trisphosphate 3-phosphatase/dual-specificity protein phosphatase PTEN
MHSTSTYCARHLRSAKPNLPFVGVKQISRGIAMEAQTAADSTSIAVGGAPPTFSGFELFVPAGGTDAIFATVPGKQLCGRWMPCTLEIEVAAAVPRVVLASDSAAVAGGDCAVFDQRPSSMFSRFRGGAPPAGTFASVEVLLDDVTFVYGVTSQTIVDAFVHPAAVVADKSDAASATYVAFRATRFLVVPHRALHHTADSVVLLRAGGAAAAAKLRSALQRDCAQQHLLDAPRRTVGWPVDTGSSKENATLLTRVTLPLKKLVSLKKRRYDEGGFHLDLVYITPNIVAMGFPVQPGGDEATVRNDMRDVHRFLELRHRGRYKVYNLCAERAYPPSSFNGRFERFPFDDHQAPPLALVFAFCRDAERFLASQRGGGGAGAGGAGVVAVHCKAGKGRTGVMIVALLIWLQRRTVTEAAVLASLALYGKQRSLNGKGIAIASQRRFLMYFYRCLAELGEAGLPLLRPVCLSAATMHGTPFFDMAGGCTPFVVVKVRRAGHMHRPIGQREWLERKGAPDDETAMVVVYDSRRGDAHQTAQCVAEPAVMIPLGSVVVQDEVFVGFYDGGQAKSLTSLAGATFMCGVWVHTSFIDGMTGVAHFDRGDIDGVKGFEAQLFPADFAMTLHFTSLPPTPRGEENTWAPPPPPGSAPPIFEDAAPGSPVSALAPQAAYAAHALFDSPVPPPADSGEDLPGDGDAAAALSVPDTPHASAAKVDAADSQAEPVAAVNVSAAPSGAFGSVRKTARAPKAASPKFDFGDSGDDGFADNDDNEDVFANGFAVATDTPTRAPEAGRAPNAASPNFDFGDSGDDVFGDNDNDDDVFAGGGVGGVATPGLPLRAAQSPEL